ncbi:MAG TPA: group 1 truncated hemoglobin [Xanthobacteraceae bacterium]|jgi:hemoglobin|nr:group 1 truncated hemoglobin [Xanthobacteraceae bacterium]
MTGRILLTAALAAVLAHSAIPTSAMAQTRTLYERLGGYEPIQAVVDQSIKNIAADKRINRFFAKADIANLRRQLADQICVASGGPCIYTGRDMKSVHAGMGVKNSHFNALVQDIGKALNKFKVPAREQRELVAALAPTRRDIVTR